MALQLINGAEFLHLPKTGGQWVRKVLYDNNLVTRTISHKHSDFDMTRLRMETSGRRHAVAAARLLRERALGRLGLGPRRAANQPIFRFCFVRHPLSWYESFWRFMEGSEKGWYNWGDPDPEQGWHPNSQLDDLGGPDFDQFMRGVIQKRPGYVSELYFSFAKPHISFIGKTENLRSDLAYVLALLELPYDKASLEQSRAKNTSKADASRVRWDPDVRRTVMQLELPALVHFDYLTDEDRDELGVRMPIPPHKALRLAPATATA